MNNLLVTENLCKSFGALQVAQNISFAVQQGEILGVIGGNGAGKTTLFALLAGNLLPDAGTINFKGINITQRPAHERAVAGLGRTYQIPKPFTHMNVMENLMIAALFGGKMDQHEARDYVHEVAKRTGLSSVLSSYAGQLPLLLRKRHELARTLAMKPDLLLVDEVAAGLTENEVQLFIELIASIRAEGVTIIWIEHVMKTMLYATDRLLALDAGRVLMIGKPDEVINSPEVQRVYLGV